MPETINDRLDKKFLYKQKNPMGSEMVNSPNVIQDTAPLKSFIAEELDEIEKEIEAAAYQIKGEPILFLKTALAIIRERRKDE